MKKVDFLLTYEVKAREIEYLELLRYELERRGYTAVLEPANSLWGRGVRYSAEVIINAGFREDRINSGTGVVFNKALELTSEQIFSNYRERQLKPRGRIKDYVVINAWGDAIKKRLIDVEKVPESKVVVFGHPVLDYCKEEFSEYFFSKSELASKFDLDLNCQWNLFISTFTVKYEKKGSVYDDIKEAKRKTYKELVGWFDKLLSSTDNQIIVYRPHPVEEIGEELLELKSKYANFKIIRDLGVRQWIKNCDRLYSWISTSSVEAYYMNRPVYFLRPCQVPAEFEAQIISHPEKAVKTFEDFKNTITEITPIERYNVFDEKIKEYYYFDKETFVYEKLADLCVEMVNNDEYALPKELKDSIYNNSVNNWKELSIRHKFAHLMRGLPIYSFYHDLFSPKVDYMNPRRGELKKIDERISKCISKRCN